MEASKLDKPKHIKTNLKAHNFTRSHRLLSASDYKNVFDKNNIRVSDKNILMLAHANERACARLGLVFGKKCASRSVDRSRLKRISREQFRLHSESLAGLDIIILGRTGVDRLAKDAYSKLIVGLMKDIKQQYSQKK